MLAALAGWTSGGGQKKEPFPALEWIDKIKRPQEPGPPGAAERFEKVVV
jgi:hypothetical protein